MGAKMARAELAEKGERQVILTEEDAPSVIGIYRFRIPNKK